MEVQIVNFEEYFKDVYKTSVRVKKVPRTYKPNGPREVERRLRQISAGTLKKENGLAS